MSDEYIKTSSKQQPYLSIVATSRNDNHGVDLLKRMQIFINGLVEQCDRHKLHAELILVEWNPPKDRKKLIEVLEYPNGEGYCSIRIIEVPPHMHDRLQHSDRLPLFQMIAKNAGIRRAKGDFILATNIDIIFSDQLMSFLASRQLEEGKFYRCDRYDISSDIPADAPLSKQLEFCEHNIIRICSRNDTLTLKTKERQVYSPAIIIFFKLRRIVGGVLRRLRLSIRWYRNYFLTNYRHAQLHTNACGDFTLMSRKSWFDLRGYLELEIFSFHLDSLLLYMAYYSKNIKEQALSPLMRIYHIDHSHGWTPEVEKDKSLVQRISSAGIPQISDQELQESVKQMRQDCYPYPVGKENWGLADEELPEIAITEK